VARLTLLSGVHQAPRHEVPGAPGHPGLIRGHHRRARCGLAHQAQPRCVPESHEHRWGGWYCDMRKVQGPGSRVLGPGF